MAPTILIVGATGNTGRSTVETLSKLLKTGGAFSGHRLLALTRSAQSKAAQQLAALSGVEVEERNWVTIAPSWLRENEVVRAFIASHNEPAQFAEESSFLVAALHAGVKYVVRISTTAANVRPDFEAYYPRSHWAIEALLGSPEFDGLQWTSLQPNVFTQMVLGPAVELIKSYRETGKQNTLRLMASADAPVGVIDPYDVGVIAAHLLSQEDTAPHNKAKYILNGPEDLTGAQILSMTEEYLGTKVEDISFKDLTFLDNWAAASPTTSHLILSIKHAPVTAYNGKCTASTTSKEILQLIAPSRTPSEVMEAMLAS